MVTMAGVGEAGSGLVLREAVPPPVARAVDKALGDQARAHAVLRTWLVTEHRSLGSSGSSDQFPPLSKG